MRYMTSRYSRLTSVALAAALGTLLLGCGGDSMTGGRTSAMTLRLTDAPGDVQHAVVIISKVYLQGGTTGDTITLLSQPDTADLTTLAAPATMTLARNVPIPAGSYDQLRFVVTGGYVAVANSGGGTDYYVTSSGAPLLPTNANVVGTLRCPSCAQSGIKVILPHDTIAVQGNQALLVDFNVAESFGHVAGHSGQWIMHPTMKATSVATSGSIMATIQSDVGVSLPIVGTDTVRFSDFIAVLTEPSGAQDTVNFSSTATTGVYAANFPYLVPGTYSLDIAAPTAVTAFATTPSLPQTITLGSGAMDSTGFTVTTISP